MHARIAVLAVATAVAVFTPAAAQQQQVTYVFRCETPSDGPKYYLLRIGATKGLEQPSVAFRAEERYPGNNSPNWTGKWFDYNECNDRPYYVCSWNAGAGVLTISHLPRADGYSLTDTFDTRNNQFHREGGGVVRCTPLTVDVMLMMVPINDRLKALAEFDQ